MDAVYVELLGTARVAGLFFFQPEISKFSKEDQKEASYSESKVKMTETIFVVPVIYSESDDSKRLKTILGCMKLNPSLG